MPWLLVHLAIPLNLLAAQFVGWAADRLDWRRVFSAPYLVATMLSLLVLGMAIPLTTVTMSPMPPSGGGLPLQSGLLWRLALAVLLCAAILGLFELGRRQGWRFLPAPIGTACILGLLALTIHIGWQVTYKNGDIPNDPLVYVQSSPEAIR